MQRTPRQIMEAEGVRLRNWSPGPDQKTTCPKCSHMRKRANRSDPCLSTRVFADGTIKTQCWNNGCDWKLTASPDGKGGGSGGRDYKPAPPEPEKILDPPERQIAPLDADTLEFFDRRGIGKATLDAFGVGLCRRWWPPTRVEENAIVFPYFRLGKLVNRKFRVNGEEGGKAFLQEKKARQTLYNEDAAREADEVIIVEGEMDVLALFEAGFENAVSLPNGAGKGANRKRMEALKNSGLLMDGKRFVIAGDRDEAGLALRRELVKFIGRGRCSAVFWPTNFDVVCKDANEVLMLHGPEVVRECIEAAESCADGLNGRVWQVEPDPDGRRD